MVIVDSTVWVDYFTGLHNLETDWLDVQLDMQRLGLSALGSGLSGLAHDDHQVRGVAGRSRRTTSRGGGDELSKLEVLEMYSVALAVQAAKNYRMLRGRGRTVRKTIDVLIATFCIEQQHSLLHLDRDFDPFEEFLGLSVVHP